MDSAEYWYKDEGSASKCLLCSNACRLGPGQKGICQARVGTREGVALPLYGAISAIAIDPVEKKPLRRFLPGTFTFSVGFWHCTMRCPFCQNWEIAQPQNISPRYMEPTVLIKEAVESGCPSISFTYSEPTLHIEYVKKCMVLARSEGLKTILVTNGNILEQPARDILALTDATNIDLKSASAEIYKKILGGSLPVVKKFIQIAAKFSHTEITTLLVPGISDDPAQILDIASFISSIDRGIPLHITPYFPAYRWRKSPLTPRITEEIAKPAYDRLDYVYLSPPRQTWA